MKKQNRMINAFFVVVVVLFFVIHIYDSKGILNVIDEIKQLLSWILDEITFKNEEIILGILFYFTCFISISVLSLKIIRERKLSVIPFLWVGLDVFSMSVIFLMKYKKIMIIQSLIDVVRLFFLVLSFLLFIYITISSSFLCCILQNRKLGNVHLEKNNEEVDNINTREKNVEKNKMFTLDILNGKEKELAQFEFALNNCAYNLSGENEELVDMEKGETKNIKPVFIIGPDGEKIYPGRTFLDRIIVSDPSLVKQYSDLKNLFLSYRKVHTRVSKTNDAFRFEGKLIGKIIVAGKGLKVYLALDPISVDSAIYHQRDASGKKKFTETPLVVKVKSPLSFRKASKLIAMACEKVTVKKTRYTPIDWTKVDAQETLEE